MNTATLRALCRDEIALIEQRTALVNQLQAALKAVHTLRDFRSRL